MIASPIASTGPPAHTKASIIATTRIPLMILVFILLLPYLKQSPVCLRIFCPDRHMPQEPPQDPFLQNQATVHP